MKFGPVRARRFEVDRAVACSMLKWWRSRINQHRSRSGPFTYSPALRRKLAFEYSRFSLAMKLALISAGQTASHS